jgi:hypothetical protein
MRARRTAPRKKKRHTHLSVVAVDEEGVVLPIQDHAQDRPHGGERDLLLLGALHVEDGVLDAVLVQERPVALGEVLLHQGAARRVVSRGLGRVKEARHVHDGLELETLDKGIVVRLREAAAVDVGDHYPKVGRPGALREAVLKIAS